jgi:hypothetical protein
LFLREGHAYFITVKVCTLNVLIVKWSRFMLFCNSQFHFLYPQIHLSSYQSNEIIKRD